MLGLLIGIGATFGLVAGTFGVIAAILWARQHAPMLFMAAMFLVLGGLTFFVGHLFAAVDTGTFGTLPAKVDVTGLAPFDRIDGQLSNMRNDLTRVVPWLSGACAAALIGCHFWPKKGLPSAD